MTRISKSGGRFMALSHALSLNLFVMLLLCFLLSCDQSRFRRERDLIKPGMTKEEVSGLFGGTGRLKKEPKELYCSRGHVWAPGVPSPLSLNPGLNCPVCGLSGKAKPESWALYESKRSYLGMPYLYISFDSSGRVDSVATSDM